MAYSARLYEPRPTTALRLTPWSFELRGRPDGEGTLTAGDSTYTIRADQIVFIPAGMPHSLSNLAGEILEIFEIYAPAGRQFDFTVVE